MIMKWEREINLIESIKPRVISLKSPMKVDKTTRFDQGNRKSMNKQCLQWKKDTIQKIRDMRNGKLSRIHYDHIFENVEDMVIFKERSNLFKLTIEEVVNESRYAIYHHYWNWNKNEL